MKDFARTHAISTLFLLLLLLSSHPPKGQVVGFSSSGQTVLNSHQHPLSYQGNTSPSRWMKRMTCFGGDTIAISTIHNSRCSLMLFSQKQKQQLHHHPEQQQQQGQDDTGLNSNHSQAKSHARARARAHRQSPLSSRREILSFSSSSLACSLFFGLTLFGNTGTSSSSSFFLSNAAYAAEEGTSSSLLEQFGTDPSKITQKIDDSSSRAPVIAKPKSESIIEPNLRSNYYYPTNKKRYLPRIKKCNDAIPDAAEAIGTGNWDAADEFVNKIADDTILPLKLYTSSLTGGGTNVKVSFTKDMFKAADDFEKAQKELVKAVKKKDQKASSKALEDLSSALSAYRVAGKLTGPDAGGDIPSVDEIRRSACRVQGRTFEQKVKARDARLAEAMAAAAGASRENGNGDMN